MSLRPRLCVSVTVLLISLGARPVCAAQEPTPISAEEVTRAETFRGDFVRLVDVLQEIATAVNDQGRYQRLTEARHLMKAVPADQIARFLRRTTPNLRPLIRANVKLQSVLAERAKTAPPVTPNTAGFPGRPAIFADCNNIAHDSAFTFGALIAVQVADTLLAAIGRVCDEVVVILGEGGNTALVCLPLEIALTAAKIPFELADFCGGEEDSSFLEGSYDRLGHIHGDLEASVANDNANATTIVNNDNANTTNILNNDNANRSLIINNDNANRNLIISNSNANTAQLVAELRLLGCEIIRLLNTPEGRRASQVLSCQAQPGFPYNFPEPPLP